MMKKEMNEFVDNFAKQSFGRTRSESFKNKVCVMCGKDIDFDDFRNEISKKEYAISGMCQKCQDDIFGKD